MRTSESTDKITPAFVAFQGELERILRNRVSDVEGKQHEWADLSELIEATRPALSGNALALTQDVTNTENRLGVVITTMLMHASGQWFVWGPLIMPCGSLPWEIASAITYGCRYAMEPALNIKASFADDDGAAAQEGVKAVRAATRQASAQTRCPVPPATPKAPGAKPAASSRQARPATKAPATPKLATPAQVNRLFKAGAALGRDEGATIALIKAERGVDHPGELDRDAASELISVWESQGGAK